MKKVNLVRQKFINKKGCLHNHPHVQEQTQTAYSVNVIRLVNVKLKEATGNRGTYLSQPPGNS